MVKLSERPSQREVTAKASHLPRSGAIDYAAWADFRHEIRKWIRISENVSAEHGIPPQQHQLLLAVKGFRGPLAPTISDLADRLQVRHHSVVELLDRMEPHGLVERRPTGEGRTTEIVLTRSGEQALREISRELEPQLQVAAARLVRALSALSGDRSHRVVEQREVPRSTPSANRSARTRGI